MGRRKNGEPPKYLEHRATGQAYSTLNGRQKYFGKFGTAESRRAYSRFVKAWERSHGREIVAEAARATTIAKLIPAYLAEIRDGISDKEHEDIERNLHQLAEEFGDFEPDEFRAAELKLLRQTWISMDHARKTINRAAGRVRRFFRWMVVEEKCEAETLAILQALPDIPVGKMQDNPQVEPVPLEDFEKTLPELKEPARSIVQLQLYAGPRPSEACAIEGGQIFRDGTVTIGRRLLKVPAGVWIFAPDKFKTKNRGKVAVYVMGPRAQAAVIPHLKEDPSERLFMHRKGIEYDRFHLYRAIKFAAMRAGVPHWGPHQIRHLFVTQVDEASDLVTASEGAGHSGIDATLVYLQRKILSVADVARRIG